MVALCAGVVVVVLDDDVTLSLGALRASTLRGSLHPQPRGQASWADLKLNQAKRSGKPYYGLLARRRRGDIILCAARAAAKQRRRVVRCGLSFEKKMRASSCFTTAPLLHCSTLLSLCYYTQ